MTSTDIDSSFELAAMLADGQVHSGADLAARLGISRTAVWKRIAKLPELGLAVTKIRSRGYRLADRIELLDIETINHLARARLDTETFTLELARQVESTNKMLLDEARSSTGGHPVFLFAEHQTGGRGRRGRTWCSPCAKNIYMSVLWSTDKGLPGLDGLSLAVGVSVATMLRDDFGVPATLKWPNDVQVNGEKLAGILIEIDGDFDGPLRVVIGIGLNVEMSLHENEVVNQPWTDMATHLSHRVSRNTVAACLITKTLQALSGFQRHGFPAFQDQWKVLDANLGQTVVVTGPGWAEEGIERGVDDQGALLLEIAGAVRRITSGEVSLRHTS